MSSEKRIKELEEENEILKNRCHAMTKGLVCVYCPMKCNNREVEYDPEFIPSEE